MIVVTIRVAPTYSEMRSGMTPRMMSASANFFSSLLNVLMFPEITCFLGRNHWTPLFVKESSTICRMKPIDIPKIIHGGIAAISRNGVPVTREYTVT